ncbi:hypothetical protein ADL22_13230 [Streptomyces sp. NRRL F-4489]|uniref:DUF5954 family protein n=1 Tax=Streptomyces sp. NRRL F-4489 TaxID=1609095 RepID=UPI00074689D1|nr:DUF5954 family protein [Streptomyces sp. NRRL F-4489]KUL43837.1 hypothetical protein ADL22_13230 [Streptomyces sp. NRRL F-4489]
MDDLGDVRPGGMRPVVVRIPVEPVEAAVEADAIDAAVRAGDIAVRGPVFGVAAQGPDDGQRWRVVVPVSSGCPQMARDSLNSLLWFRAKDEAQDRAERRALLAAVGRLERERVNELTVLGTRYRVVRAEEYAGVGPNGIELPRPTDPDPLAPDWSRGGSDVEIDDGLVLDPDAPLTPAQAAERLALRGFSYSGYEFPDDARRDSRRALATHPDVLLLPATFMVVERKRPGWQPASSLHGSPHDARKTLDFSLVWWDPRSRGLIPPEAGYEADARTHVAENPDSPDEELAAYAQAADRLRADRLNELEVLGTVYRIGRIRRLVRWGPDGPEGPRPSDRNRQEPDRIHPFLDEDGNVHFEHEEGEEGEASPRHYPLEGP